MDDITGNKKFNKVDKYNEIFDLQCLKEALDDVKNIDDIKVDPSLVGSIDAAIEKRKTPMEETVNYAKKFFGKYVGMLFSVHEDDNKDSKNCRKIVMGMPYYYNEVNGALFGVFCEINYYGNDVDARFFDGPIHLRMLLENYDMDIEEVRREEWFEVMITNIQGTWATRQMKNKKCVLTENGYEYPDRCTQMSTEEEF